MTTLKGSVLILIIGALLAIVVFGHFKVRNLERTVNEQADQYETTIKDLKDYNKAERDMFLREKEELELKVDSLTRELLKINQYSVELEIELEKVLGELELVSEDSSYRYTQKILGPTEEPKSFGYSGNQVKEMHKLFILSDYKDSIKIQMQKSIGLLNNTIDHKDNIIETLEFIADNYSVETDTLYNIIGDLKDKKQVAEEESVKYKQQRNFVGVAALIGTAVAVILSNF